MWDFTTEPVKATVERHYKAGKVLSSVCHGPAGFVKPEDDKGQPIVKGKKVGRARARASSVGGRVCSGKANGFSFEVLGYRLGLRLCVVMLDAYGCEETLDLTRLSQLL